MSAGLDVVTGGAGFIGSHLAEALLARGRRVRVVDDFSTGRRGNLPAGAELVEGDVAAVAAETWRGAEVVYHLAAMPSVPGSVERPLESHRITAGGTLAALAAAERAGARRLVFAGSSAVYGEGPESPKREDLPPRPSSPYAAAKLAGELYARDRAARGTLETVCLRFFNVYGPRQDPASPYAAVIPLFIRALREGRAMPVYGDGLQTRDFVYVGDVVKALLAAGTAAGVSGRVFNVAGGRPVSVLELGRALARQAGLEPRFEHRPSRPGDIRASLAEVAALRSGLGVAAETPLEEGLRRTWGASG